MKHYRNGLLYIGILGGFAALMYWIVIMGEPLEQGRRFSDSTLGTTPWNDFLSSLETNLHHPLAILLAQIVTIIFAARVLSWVCKKIGQPMVIGEIVAGIMLGPSIIGYYFPEISLVLFPVHSLGNLQFISQIGLILFMFIIGMELDIKVLKTKAHDAIVISHASIIIPFALGMGLAYFLYEQFSPEGVKFLSFGLFIGISMSITAFPVLARIIQERDMHKTHLGSMVITCAAADDITAWCTLAAIIAIVKAGSFISAIYIILLAVAYVVFMFKLVKPFLKRIGDLHSSREKMGKPIVAIFFVVLLLSSYATEVIGIHALFGAFLMGTIMPENPKFRSVFIQKIEDVAMVLLLPLFFVYTGLRTEIGLLNDWELWKITGVIILVAVIGKFVGSALTARVVGQNWRDSLIIGVLMNTRGLMELVVLNIGYDLGVITPEIFTMLVIMAVVTTFMTGPALDLIDKFFKADPSSDHEAILLKSKFKVLISFANPDSGKSMLRIANGLVKKLGENATVTLVHFSMGNMLHRFNIEEYENESFEPIVAESMLIEQPIITMFKASNDVDADILDVANKGDYDLLLIGIGQSIFEGSLLGQILGYTTRIIMPDKLFSKMTGKDSRGLIMPFDERTSQLIGKSQIPVGVLIHKKISSLDNILLVLTDASDLLLIPYVLKFIHNSGSHVVVYDSAGLLNSQAELKEAIRIIKQNAPQHISVIIDFENDNSALSNFDLVLVNIVGWKKVVDSYGFIIKSSASVLVVKT